MKRDGKSQRDGKAHLSVAQIAAVAGVSETLVRKKVNQGKSARDIIADAIDRERQMVRDLPVTPITNGHAGAIGLVPFSVSQARKEAALARIREAEADERAGDLMPTEQAKRWMLHLFVPLVQSISALPDELRDLLGPELSELLRRRVEGVIGAADRYWVSCRDRSGKPLSDGSLDCGNGYRVVWSIIPPPLEAA